MILLNRPYQGYLAGTIVEMATSTEAALIAQGFAVTSAGPVTGGNVNAGSLNAGSVGVAIAAASVVVTSSNVTAESKVFAVVAQAAADATALRVERIVCAAGSFTIYVTAAATALTLVDWVLMTPTGMTTTN